MTPVVFLNGVLLGTCGSIAFGLCIVMVLFAGLGKSSPQVAPEWDVLSTYTAIFLVMTALCAFSFIGHLKKRHWRWYAQGAMGLGLMATLFKIFGP